MYSSSRGDVVLRLSPDGTSFTAYYTEVTEAGDRRFEWTGERVAAEQPGGPAPEVAQARFPAPTPIPASASPFERKALATFELALLLGLWDTPLGQMMVTPGSGGSGAFAGIPGRGGLTLRLTASEEGLSGALRDRDFAPRGDGRIIRRDERYTLEVRIRSQLPTEANSPFIATAKPLDLPTQEFAGTWQTNLGTLRLQQVNLAFGGIIEAHGDQPEIRIAASAERGPNGEALFLRGAWIVGYGESQRAGMLQLRFGQDRQEIFGTCRIGDEPDDEAPLLGERELTPRLRRARLSWAAPVPPTPCRRRPRQSLLQHPLLDLDRLPHQDRLRLPHPRRYPQPVSRLMKYDVRVDRVVAARDAQRIDVFVTLRNATSSPLYATSGALMVRLEDSDGVGKVNGQVLRPTPEGRVHFAWTPVIEPGGELKAKYSFHPDSGTSPCE